MTEFSVLPEVVSRMRIADFVLDSRFFFDMNS